MVRRRAEIDSMLRALLAERFKLAAHYEMRERPTYALVRSATSLGPQIRRYEGDCAAHDSAVQQGRETQMPIPSSGGRPCGYSIGRGGIIAGGIEMSTVARAVKFYTDRTVIDKTGLTGYYEFKLEMSSDISIFTAIREQLGLKLESERTPLPVLVVDHLERPTED